MVLRIQSPKPYTYSSTTMESSLLFLVKKQFFILFFSYLEKNILKGFTKLKHKVLYYISGIFYDFLVCFIKDFYICRDKPFLCKFDYAFNNLMKN